MTLQLLKRNILHCNHALHQRLRLQLHQRLDQHQRRDLLVAAAGVVVAHHHRDHDVPMALSCPTPLTMPPSSKTAYSS